MAATCVVHLVWAPLGPEPLERFVASYRAHPAGAEHRMLVVFKEFASDAGLADARRMLAGIEYDETHMPRRRLDLVAYRDVVASVTADDYFFCNSTSELRADGWLAAMRGHLYAEGVGMVGASGSWESGLSPARLPLRALRWPRFGPFPNPHLRTNAFMLERGLARSLRWPTVRRKEQAWALEGGRRGLSRQVLDSGLQVLVVGRDGCAYPPAEWAASGTFRQGDQGNLLVADNRTRDFDDADRATRRRLADLAWGTAAA